MFIDIKILTVDEIRTHKPSPDVSFYNVFYELSSVPPPEWKQIFEKEFPYTKNLVGKNAWIEGRHIVVQCAITEIDSLLNDMRHEVVKINQKYRELLQKQSV